MDTLFAAEAALDAPALPFAPGDWVVARRTGAFRPAAFLVVSIRWAAPGYLEMITTPTAGWPIHGKACGPADGFRRCIPADHMDWQSGTAVAELRARYDGVLSRATPEERAAAKESDAADRLTEFEWLVDFEDGDGPNLRIVRAVSVAAAERTIQRLCADHGWTPGPADPMPRKMRTPEGWVEITPAMHPLIEAWFAERAAA